MLAAWLVSSVAIGGSGSTVNPSSPSLVLFGVGIAIGAVNGFLMVRSGSTPSS